jgi:hypothetical protein
LGIDSRFGHCGLIPGQWNELMWSSAADNSKHFTLVREQRLTPSIAFTSVAVFNELRFALNALPETFIQVLQGEFKLLPSAVTSADPAFRLCLLSPNREIPISGRGKLCGRILW